MEAAIEIREITKIKKADNLSTLNDMDKSGGNESKTKEKEKFPININKEEPKLKIEPQIAKELPQTLANLLFLFNAKDPTAPIPNNSKAVKNKVGEEMTLDILFAINHCQNFKQMTKNGFGRRRIAGNLKIHRDYFADAI